MREGKTQLQAFIEASLFLNRMDKVDTRVIVVAGEGGWSKGFDTEMDLNRLPLGYSGGIWTNRVELIAPIFKGKKE